jgi:hypothetical protein
VNITDQLQQITVCIEKKSFVSPLEKMSSLAFTAVYIPGIAKGEVLDDTGKWDLTPGQ